MSQTYDNECSTAIRLAETAGYSALRLFQQGAPACKADHSAHRIISRGLQAEFPDIPIVSEEGLVPDYSMGPGRWWLVDPVDGSNFFQKGEPCWSIMLALMEQGRPKLGVVHDPIGNNTWYGIVGVGAYKVKTDTPLTISSRTDLNQSTIIVKPRDTVSLWIQRLLDASLIKSVKGLGSVGLRACSVASGNSDALLHPDTKLKTWDTAAGEAIINAAGGLCGDIEGGLLNYNPPNVLHTKGVIMSNFALYDCLLKVMEE